ncbi:Uncharacterised protein [Mycobacteroides abscessus subsp. abscessus]|nr:Uncharacterised protein [Mycobacteroides abscessus subsp. abscessus]
MGWVWAGLLRPRCRRRMRSVRRIVGVVRTGLVRMGLMLRSFSRRRCPVRCRIIRVGSISRRWIKTVRSRSITRRLRRSVITGFRGLVGSRGLSRGGISPRMALKSRIIKMPPRIRRGRVGRIRISIRDRKAGKPTKARRAVTRVLNSSPPKTSRRRTTPGSRRLNRTPNSPTSPISRRLMI